jgi:hypothetical protein
MWGTEWRLNPLSFTLMWSGAAVVMWSLSRRGYPGVVRHIVLAAISMPVWWWFELVNERVRNWEYDYPFRYTQVEWAVLSTLAFATVIPAIAAAHQLVITASTAQSSRSPDRWFARREIGLGLLLQALVFVYPTQLYPLVWVAPFLVTDGLVALLGGRSMVADLIRRRWKEALLVGAAGLLCGFLWEFWNFYATPKWVYHIPLLGFGKIFEMPVLGYGGYIPFAWSIIQFIRLADILWRRSYSRIPAPFKPQRAVEGSRWEPAAQPRLPGGQR